jgi:hypothetical protein
MSFFKKNHRVLLCCFTRDTADSWKEQFAQAGIAISDYSQRTVIRSLSSQSILVLKDFPFTWYTQNDNRVLFEKWIVQAKHVFLLSGDEQWNDTLKMKNFTILPAAVHPLEVARYLVEKHMIVPVKNTSTHAFTFFQF